MSEVIFTVLALLQCTLRICFSQKIDQKREISRLIPDTYIGRKNNKVYYSDEKEYFNVNS